MLYVHQHPTDVTVDRLSEVIILHIDDDKVILNDREITWNRLKSRSDFRPYSKFLFPLKRTGVGDSKLQDQYGGYHYYPKALEPFELYGITKNTKTNVYEFVQQNYFNCSVVCLTYPESTGFKSCVITVVPPANANTPFRITTTDSNGDIVDYPPDRTTFPEQKSLLPKSTLTPIGQLTRLNGQEIEFVYRDYSGNTTAVNFEAEVSVDAGYVSKRKINVVNGVCRFRFIPLGLEEGDTAKIQVGIGNYTDVANCTINIVTG